MLHTGHMTQHAHSSNVPQVTLGWRLKMALAYGDVAAHDMADQLGVARATVSRWMADKGTPPRRAYLTQWALITGVDVNWLIGNGAPVTRITRGYFGLSEAGVIPFFPAGTLPSEACVTRQLAPAA
jgi:transcriptional regulator with XRE-family HTH domain